MNSQIPEPQQREPSRTQQYFIGIGIGVIPLVVALVGFGLLSSTGLLLIIAVFLYIAECVAWIVLLSVTRTRFIGYGLLTMWLVTPVIFFIACVVLTTRSTANSSLDV